MQSLMRAVHGNFSRVGQRRQFAHVFQVADNANGCSQNPLPLLHHKENAPACYNSHKKCA